MTDHADPIRTESLLDSVRDRDTFIAFVQALADERERAQEIERQNPDRYTVDGALGVAKSLSDQMSAMALPLKRLFR